MKALIVILIVLLPFTAHAADPWSNQDIALEATYIILHTIDWGQTRYIAKNPSQYRELNPILGEHPSLNSVNVYFLGTTALHLGITHLMPSRYRPYFQGITIGISGACVAKNLSIGIGLEW